MTTCIFCQFDDPAVNRVLARNHTCYARHDNFPLTPGHVEVVPLRHVASLFELMPDEWDDVYELLHEAKAVIDAEHAPDGYNVGVNDGRAAGRTVDHLHIHLIPRYVGDVPDPRGGVRNILPGPSPDAWTR